jgi:hypothetical protein
VTLIFIPIMELKNKRDTICASKPFLNCISTHRSRRLLPLITSFPFCLSTLICDGIIYFAFLLQPRFTSGVKTSAMLQLSPHTHKLTRKYHLRRRGAFFTQFKKRARRAAKNSCSEIIRPGRIDANQAAPRTKQVYI